MTITSPGEVFFTDVDKRQIGEEIKRREVEYVVGSGRDERHNGCQESASFVQPTGLCSEGDSLYVTDTGTGALKLITPTKPIAKFLENVRVLDSSDGIHSPMPLVESCISSIEKAKADFEKAVEDAKCNSAGRKIVEGLHGVPSSKTIGSVRMTLEALKKIKNNISAINPSYVARIQPKSLVTLIVEHFNSKMREVYEVLTVIQYACQFPEAVEETVKRITNCGFSYFTNRESYYEVPENMVSFEAKPKIPRLPKRPGTQEDVLVL